MRNLDRLVLLYPMYFVYRLVFPFFKPGHPLYSHRALSYVPFSREMNDVAVVLGFLLWLCLLNVLLIAKVLWGSQ